MTLIAKFSVNGVPLLIGDVLVSSDAITGRKTTLPLVGDINKVIADHEFAPLDFDLSRCLLSRST